MVMVDQQQLFFLAIDLGNQTGLDPLDVFAAGSHEGQELLIFDLEDRSGDLCRLERLELEFLPLAVGSHDDFDRLDLVATADELFEVDRHGLLVLVVGPFEVRGGTRLEVSDVSAVGPVLGMLVTCMIVLRGGFGVPMVMIVVVVMVVSGRTRFGSTRFGSVAANPYRDACHQGQYDPIRDFHGRYFFPRVAMKPKR